MGKFKNYIAAVQLH